LIKKQLLLRKIKKFHHPQQKKKRKKRPDKKKKRFDLNKKRLTMRCLEDTGFGITTLLLKRETTGNHLHNY